MNELQDLVDALATELGRPVGLDDRRFRSLAYSSHFEEVDEVRLASILHREAPKAATRWLESLRVQDAEWFIRVPANPELGMASRVCVPVRWQTLLLGYLWLIDEPRRVEDGEIEAALRTAGTAGLVLYRLRLLENADRARERRLAGRLLGARHQDRETAARQLIDGGFLEPTPVFGVIVARAAHAERPVGDPVRVRLAAALEQLRRALPPQRLVTFVEGDLVAALVACADAAELSRGAEIALDRAATALEDSPGWRAILGLGEPRGVLAEAHLSCREARHAAGLADAMPALGDVVRWPDLGAYRTIARLLDASSPADALPESLRRVLSCPDAEVLVPTLESYLEHGGDAKASAASLFVHRSSLYNRLHRIEEIAGVDLRQGDDRLELHLGLRLWRMEGRDRRSDADAANATSAARFAAGTGLRSGDGTNAG